MKDLFSNQSNEYAKFRPSYPIEVAADLSKLCKACELAWDAGTGNGQLAVLLAKHFSHVSGTDISEKQLANAQQHPNITYSTSDSTTTRLSDHSVDLVTVAQAVHWFNFELFYKEVRRVLKPDGVIALVGYGVMRGEPLTDAIIQDFYHNTMGPYWDKERLLIDNNYRSIPFPFQEIEMKSYSMKYSWSIDQLVGYFSTWSALQHYKNKTGVDPLPQLRKRFLETGSLEFKVDFPLFFRVGKQQ